MLFNRFIEVIYCVFKFPIHQIFQYRKKAVYCETSGQTGWVVYQT